MIRTVLTIGEPEELGDQSRRMLQSRTPIPDLKFCHESTAGEHGIHVLIASDPLVGAEPEINVARTQYAEPMSVVVGR